MTAEGEVRPRRSALASARAWQAVELSPELRRGVQTAADRAGIEPEAWLTRTILKAASAAAPRETEATLPEKPNAEVARSLAMLLSAARARSRERQADASALTLVEPAPPDDGPRAGTAHPVKLTAERADAGPAQQLPTLYYAPPQPGRHLLALVLLAVTVSVAFGAGAFYIRYGGTPPAAQPVLTAALPPSSRATPAPKSDIAIAPPAAPSAVTSPAPTPATAPSAPQAAAPGPASPGPIPAVPPPAQPAAAPPPAPGPATAASLAPPPSLPVPAPAPQPSPPDTKSGAAAAQPPPPATTTPAAPPAG